MPVNSQLFPWQWQCSRKHPAAEATGSPRGLGTRAGGRGALGTAGLARGPTPLRHRSLPPQPRPSGASRRGPAPSSSASLGSPCTRQRPRSDPASPALGPGARHAHSALSHRAQRFRLRGRGRSGSSYGGTSGSKREVPPRPSYRLRRRSGGERVRPAAEGVPGVTNKARGAEPLGGPKEPRTWASRTTDSARRGRG